MIRTRRVSIRVQHTEVAASVTQVFQSSADGSPATLPTNSSVPDVCPYCGAITFVPLLDAFQTLALTTAALKTVADEGRLHLFCSPQNEIWVCGLSIQQLKENS
ncbi:hypothetical protein [Tunturiibacter lichenicola]|uniref:hypothetical protein n=1 Tax=Tunturiibacter lichenicola TaxID=2051959 RepID=UPI0021B43551|nr:hypothetical protein [Edaphobacter lichenicola]